MGIKQKLGLGVVAGVLGVSLVSGGTYALFTATSETETGTISTGTVSFDQVANSTFTIDKLVPGDGDTTLTGIFGEHGKGHLVVKGLKFKYTGNVPAWVTVDQLNKELGSAVTGQSPTGDDVLFEVIGYKVGNKFHTKVEEGLLPAGFQDLVKYTSVVGLPQEAVAVEGGQEVEIWVKAGLDREAGNEYQDSTWNLGLNVKAVQRDHNPDAPLVDDEIQWTQN